MTTRRPTRRARRPPRLQPATATIQGCAPQCLPPNITYPGNVPKGTYKTEYFFAGQMTVVFDKGWAVSEDSTGEFASAPNKNPDFRSFSGKTCIRHGTSKGCDG